MKTSMQTILRRISPGILARIEQLGADLSESQFTASVETLLQREHRRLVRDGMAECQAAIAVHAAVVVISQPGLAVDASANGVSGTVLALR